MPRYIIDYRRIQPEKGLRHGNQLLILRIGIRRGIRAFQLNPD